GTINGMADLLPGIAQPLGHILLRRPGDLSTTHRLQPQQPAKDRDLVRVPAPRQEAPPHEVDAPEARLGRGILLGDIQTRPNGLGNAASEVLRRPFRQLTDVTDRPLADPLVAVEAD